MNMAKKKVTLYSKPACVQCTATERWLKSNGYEDFTHASAVDIVDALKTVLEVAQAPVIKVVDESTGETTTWTGYNPILLEKHLKIAAPAAEANAEIAA
jgi:glutaredoxin-like protein NrdH